MDSITLKSNAKINLGLNITRKRDDGFHDLETIFFPVYSLFDTIEIKKSERTEIESNIKGDFNNEDNLIIKAIRKISSFTGKSLTVNVKLVKHIPIGAGLGGGSSNAAFTLFGINNLFDLNISIDDLTTLALELGSDVPFFLLNKPALAYGRGEILKALDFSYANYNLILVNPGIHVSTKEAFASITPREPDKKLEELLHTNDVIQGLNSFANNDFEPYIFGKHPEIKAIKDTLINKGSIYASMSGTGSTVFGFFNKNINLNEVVDELPDSYFKHIAIL